MDHKLLPVNIGRLRRVAVFGIGAGLIAAALAGCTGSSRGKASASPSPSSRSTIRTLPSLPTVPQNTVVARQTHDAGHYSFHSVALASTRNAGHTRHAESAGDPASAPRRAETAAASFEQLLTWSPA